MSGHSKWATIHRKKGELDEKRGKVFQKLAKELYVAAKTGSKDPETNANLRMVIEKAKASNMPKDNIQKAIDKASRAGDGENYEAIRYEGYGPFGIAVMVDCLTDNKNRTAALIRSGFSKNGGNLGTDGSVSYMFEHQGLIVIPSDYDEEEVMMICLDNGAIDFIKDEEVYQIYTTKENLLIVKKALESIGVKEFLTSEVTYIPLNKMIINEEDKEKVYTLIDALEDIDDTTAVYHNLED